MALHGTPEPSHTREKEEEAVTARIFVCLFSLTLFLAGSPGEGAGTKRWLSESRAQFEGGELSGVTLSSRGRLAVGRARSMLDGPGRVIWDMAVGPEGRIWLASGDMAGLYRLDRSNGKEPFERMARVDDIAITCLTFFEGRPVFGSIADGRIYALEKGQAQLLVSLPTPYVWDLLVHDGRLFAATGPDGRIWEIRSGQEPRVHCETGQLHCLCMVEHPQGGILVGSSQEGVLLRVADDGTFTVLHDFEEDEVVAMVAKDDRVWVAVNRLKGRRREATAASAQKMAEFDRLGAELMTRFGGERGAAALQDRARGAQGQDYLPGGQKEQLEGGSVYRLWGSGRVERVFHGEGDYVLDLQRGDDGLLWIATGPRGRVFTVDEEGEEFIRFDFDREQVMRLLLKGSAPWLMATGHGSALVTVEDRPDDTAVYRSEVFDAAFMARWGRASWRSDGPVELALRSGQTAEPDGSWSPWSLLQGKDEALPACPPGRFLQYRLRWPEAERGASLSRMAVYYRCANQRPEISELRVFVPTLETPTPAGAAKERTDGKEEGEGDLASRIRKELGVGRAEKAGKGSPSSGGGRLRPGHLRITWQGKDPDGDRLVYRVGIQGEGEDGWIELSPADAPLESPSFSWETEALADGRYRVRVEGSDEEANGPGESLRHEAISEPFIVDNTRPRLRIDSVNEHSGEVRGRVFDETSSIRKLRCSLDGGRWRSLVPEDGLFDGREELFRFVLPGWKPGPHVVAVKAWDEAGNVGAARKAVRGGP